MTATGKKKRQLLYIVSEVVIPVRHCLMALPGTAVEDITDIWSHPQSLMQSAAFLDSHPVWTRHELLNNAFAARKISLCLEIPHRPGALYQIISHFTYNSLNLTNIESRPIPDRNWEYRFFIDFEGSLSNPAVRTVLTGLREEVRGMKILGCY